MASKVFLGSSFFKFPKKCIHTTETSLKKIVPKNSKGASSTEWLSRQLSDPYIEKSKMMNLRCRSAFKLMEIDDKYKFLAPGQVVIDCGAAPGSWTQVAVKRVNADGSNSNHKNGIVISIDKLLIYPIEGAIILGNSDFTLEETQRKVSKILQEKKVNVFLSDMAPNATGIREMDNDNIEKLCFSALGYALQVCEIDATFLVKMWQSKQSKDFENRLIDHFKSVKVVKPPASRSDSREIFLLARNFVR